MKKKYIITFFITLVCLSALFVAFLPAIFSTEWGKNQVLSYINSQIPGKVNISSMSVSWSGPQEFKNITLNDPTDKQVLNLQSLTSDTSIFGYIYDGLKGAKAEIQGLNLTIEEEQPGHTNLHNALGNTYLPYRLEHASRTPLFINLINVDAKLALPYGDEWPVVYAKGQTQYGNLSGDFTINSEADETLAMQLSHFPIALVDHLISMQKPELTGFTRACLGELLDLTLTHTHHHNVIDFSMNAKSTNLIADFSGHVTKEKIALDKTSSATFSVTPELLTFVEQINGEAFPFRLQKPAQIAIALDRLSIPFSFFGNEGVQQDLDLDLLLTLSQADFISKEELGPTTIRQLQTSLQTLANGTATLVLQGEIVQEGRPFEIDADAIFKVPSHIDEIRQSIEKQLDMKWEVKGFPAFLAEQIIDLKMNGEIHGSLASNANVVVNVEAKSKPQSTLSSIFGKTMQLRFDTSLYDMQKWGSLKIDILSDLLVGKLRGKVDESGQFLLTAPAEIKYDLIPAVFEKNGSIHPELLTLLVASPLNLTVYPSRFPINLKEVASGHISEVRLNGTLETSALSFLSQKRDNIVINNLKLPWEINSHFNRINVDLSGRARLIQDAEGNLTGKMTITNWLKENRLNLEAAALNAHVSLDKLPVIFFVAMVPNQEALLNFLGTTLNIKLDANISQLGKHEGTLELALQGDQLQGNMGVKIGKSISLKNPSQPITIQTTLTPERFSAIRHFLNPESASRENTSRLALLESTNFTATIRKMEIPLEGNKALIPMELIADLNIDELKVKRPLEHQPIVLSKLSAHFDSQNMAKNMSFRFEGAEKGMSDIRHPFYCTGAIENLFTENGTINVDGLSLYAEAKSQHLPAGLFCQLACISEETQNRLEALFGDTFETDIKARLKQMNGPIQASIKGQNGRLKLDAQLNSGVIKLNSPFEIEVEVTPKLGKSILEEILPVISDVISAESPLKISVDPKGFAVPVQPFSLDSIQMDNATITMGKMVFGDKGDLGDIFDLLKPASNQELSMWFTPAYLTMNDGILRLKRMDMLMIGKYPLALWGKVDTNKDKVDMRIGLSGVALNQALGIEVEPDVMMQIPLTGPMRDASIDKGKAAARLSALVAQTKGGAHNLLIGAFLDIAGGSLAEEKPPAPTTNPLPWANLMQSTKKAPEKKTTEKKSSEDEKPSKQEKKKKKEKELEEAATTLLDQLFH